jgi:Holliday junction resolvase RusA-like endonuclease
LSDNIILRIAGEAKGKARPKFDPRTRRAFNPPANIVSENDIRAVWREAGEPRLPDVGLVMIIQVTVPRPGGHFKSDGTLSAEGIRNPTPKKKKPDLDNVAKTALDALNTRAYKDDKQIVRLVITRIWGEWAEMTIQIRQHGDEL